MRKNHAIILAAGQGIRLGPLTNNTPKCLIRVGGRPILYHQLSALEKNDIKDVSLVIGFLADKVKEYALKNFPGIQFDFIINPDYKTTNTLYSLALAAEKENSEKIFFQLNGDVIFNPDIIKLLKETEAQKSYIAVQLKKCEAEEIKAFLGKNGAIKSLNKKMDPSQAIGEAIGINKFSGFFWKELKISLSQLKKDFANEYFEYAIEKTISKKSIFPFPIGRLRAIEIDFLKDLEKAQKLFSFSHEKRVSK